MDFGDKDYFISFPADAGKKFEKMGLKNNLINVILKPEFKNISEINPKLKSKEYKNYSIEFPKAEKVFQSYLNSQSGGDYSKVLDYLEIPKKQKDQILLQSFDYIFVFDPKTIQKLNKLKVDPLVINFLKEPVAGNLVYIAKTSNVELLTSSLKKYLSHPFINEFNELMKLVKISEADKKKIISNTTKHPNFIKIDDNVVKKLNGMKLDPKIINFLKLPSVNRYAEIQDKLRKKKILNKQLGEDFGSYSEFLYNVIQLYKVKPKKSYFETILNTYLGLPPAQIKNIINISDKNSIIDTKDRVFSIIQSKDNNIQVTGIIKIKEVRAKMDKENFSGFEYIAEQIQGSKVETGDQVIE